MPTAVFICKREKKSTTKKKVGRKKWMGKKNGKSDFNLQAFFHFCDRCMTKLAGVGRCKWLTTCIDGVHEIRRVVRGDTCPTARATVPNFPDAFGFHCRQLFFEHFLLPPTRFRQFACDLEKRSPALASEQILLAMKRHNCSQTFLRETDNTEVRSPWPWEITMAFSAARFFQLFSSLATGTGECGGHNSS